MRRTVLVIDDDPDFRGALCETLSDLDFETVEAGTVSDALMVLERTRVFAILIDYKMPYITGIDGLALIRKIPSAAQTPIVMITSYMDASTTVEAIAKGAFDYLTKPVTREQIKSVFKKIENQFIESSNETPEPSDSSTFVSVNPQMREILKQVGRVSQTDLSVLITGQTGTGKEMIARMIHTYSPRRDAPFVALNCAAIPSELLESELFGHAKGSFTGAISDKEGAFARAKNGTIFLDEIGDMNLALQAKLLRVLQEKEVSPVGSSKSVKIHARFVSATHQNLIEKVAQRLFREDLWFRLNAAIIDLPPLSERPEDIAPLAAKFLPPGKRLTSDSIDKLHSYTWPGNIRELKNVIENAAAMSPGPLITSEFIQLRDVLKVTPKSDDVALPDAIAKLERDRIGQALELTKQNRTEAAKILGIGRQLLYAKMKQHGFSN